MRPIAMTLGALVLVAASVGAQQPPPPAPMLTGPVPAARQASEDLLAIPKLDPKAIIASLDLTAPLGSILDAISEASGVNLSFDADVKDLRERTTVKLSNSTAEAALELVLKPRGLAFKAILPKAALVYPDTPEGRAKYTDVVRTFTIAHADVGSLTQLLNKTFTTTVRGSPRPVIVANRESRTISVRTNAAVMAEIARLIAENDK